MAPCWDILSHKHKQNDTTGIFGSTSLKGAAVRTICTRPQKSLMNQSRSSRQTRPPNTCVHTLTTPTLSQLECTCKPRSDAFTYKHTHTHLQEHTPPPVKAYNRFTRTLTVTHCRTFHASLHLAHLCIVPHIIVHPNTYGFTPPTHMLTVMYPSTLLDSRQTPGGWQKDPQDSFSPGLRHRSLILSPH